MTRPRAIKTALDHVRLAYISRVRISLQHENGFLGKTNCGETIVFTVLPQEMFRQGNDIRPALPQGRTVMRTTLRR